MHGPITLVVHDPPQAHSEPGGTVKADSLSPPGRCCGPAAATALRHSRGICGHTRAQTSPGTPGIHPPLDPSASWEERDRQTDRQTDRQPDNQTERHTTRQRQRERHFRLLLAMESEICSMVEIVVIFKTVQLVPLSTLLLR